MLVQVHRLDQYKQKWPKTLVWGHDLDLYKHLTNLGGRRPTEGGWRSPAGESFPPCPSGQPRSGRGERGEASATKQKKPALRLACSVDYTGKISNLLEDLRKVERFDYWWEGMEVYGHFIMDENGRIKEIGCWFNAC